MQCYDLIKKNRRGCCITVKVGFINDCIGRIDPSFQHPYRILRWMTKHSSLATWPRFHSKEITKTSWLHLLRIKPNSNEDQDSQHKFLVESSKLLLIQDSLQSANFHLTLSVSMLGYSVITHICTYCTFVHFVYISKLLAMLDRFDSAVF